MKHQPTIIDAIKNPKLFGSLPRFKTLETWTAWLVVLKAIFGLPMTAESTIWSSSSATPDAYIHRSAVRKKRISSSVGVVVSLSSPRWSPVSSPASSTSAPSSLSVKLSPVMCLAKDKDQARIVFRYIKAILNYIPALKSMIVDQRADEIELTTGVTIMVKASDFGGVRGPTIACVVADEIASGRARAQTQMMRFSPPLDRQWEFPSQALMHLDRLCPNRRTYDAHKQHYGKDDDDILVWQADTASMNPTISQAYIDKEIEKDQAGRAEWLGYSVRMFRRHSHGWIQTE